jgi:hypothetical protein
MYMLVLEVFDTLSLGLMAAFVMFVVCSFVLSAPLWLHYVASLYLELGGMFASRRYGLALMSLKVMSLDGTAAIGRHSNLAFTIPHRSAVLGRHPFFAQVQPPGAAGMRSEDLSYKEVL